MELSLLRKCQQIEIGIMTLLFVLFVLRLIAKYAFHKANLFLLTIKQLLPNTISHNIKRLYR